MRFTKTLSGGAFILGLACLILGFFSFEFVREKIYDEFKRRLPLTNGSSTTQKWANVNVPVYMKFYLFHITNPENVTNGERPVFQEKGPYVYRVIRKREILGWNENETLISYKTTKYYKFEPNLTTGDMDEEVTILNLPFIGLCIKSMEALKESYFASYFAIPALEKAISSYDAKAFVTGPVRNLLFDGFEAKFTEDILSVMSSVSGNLPKPPPDGKFGIMRGKNGSNDGIYTMFTGKGNVSELGQIQEWGDSQYLTCWNRSTCNKIDGTDGTIFQPFVTPETKLVIFSSDVNRSIHMTYEQSSKAYGLDSYKFTLPVDVFKAGTRNPNNNCYCRSQMVLENDVPFCELDGVLDLSTCAKGLPLVISLPHFYMASPALIQEAIGLEPDKDKHQTIIELDPLTGIILKARKRLQVNVQIRELKDLQSLSKLRSMVFPVAWFEEEAEVGQNTADALYNLLHKKIWFAKLFSYALLVVGCMILVLLAVSVIIQVFTKKSNKAEKPGSLQLNGDYTYSSLQKKVNNPIG